MTDITQNNAIAVETGGSLLSRVATYKVGPVPLPLYLAIAGVVFGASVIGKLPADMIGGFAAIMVLGFLLGEIGGRIPYLKSIGGSAILCLFVPSAMLGYQIMNPATSDAIKAVMKTSNFLYLYIACLVTGSMLGMNRKVLIQGFLKMFVPLAVGTIAAVAAGGLVGMAFGYEFKHTFFFIVMPIVAGGIGEGILPLSLAYSDILGTAQPELIASLIPAALIGNVVAIISSGVLKRIGEKKPQYSGNGLLVRTGNDNELLKEMAVEKKIELPLMGAGLLMACTMFILGAFLSPFTGIPGPILMIIGAALLKVSKLIPERMETGAHQMYKFMTTNMTFPLLVGLGTLYVPWNDLIAAFTPAYFAICASTVLAMVASGWLIGKVLKMYEVEAAIVTCCHSGLGGTGDVAILSASNRMGLMPFAQISTRIGGAAMVVLAVFLLKALG
ncbi:malate permease [Pleomorphomonas diazotrophica]|uniref:Malate permease n=1 Tax=Pleomorphomonas diazotrophica TaxID=1166257 RepID=A0A1I4QFK4_9HYPH|nr:2-hydroxycarboxylate transporter family protein [Pleomorphomonas diazotrophica]PKR90721.1 malate permease [Pleomorphomonas diazotrophica]SFM38420.1 malate:Na+ symporter [Pleomorphomonas diazotrophica]